MNFDPAPWRLFLDYGPLGLAGLLLVLTIAALAAGNLTAGKERILRLFLYVGAVCFLAALGASVFAPGGSYRLSVVVQPTDLDGSTFPPPAISLNGARVERNAPIVLDENATLQVDVSRALGLFDTQARTLEVQEEQLTAARTNTALLTRELGALDTQLQSLRALDPGSVRDLERSIDRLQPELLELQRTLELPQ